MAARMCVEESCSREDCTSLGQALQEGQRPYAAWSVYLVAASILRGAKRHNKRASSLEGLQSLCWASHAEALSMNFNLFLTAWRVFC